MSAGLQSKGCPSLVRKMSCSDQRTGEHVQQTVVRREVPPLADVVEERIIVVDRVHAVVRGGRISGMGVRAQRR